MDKLSLGLSTTVIGMLVVFSGLVILIACIYTMTVFTGRKARKAPAAPATKAAPEEDALPEADAQEAEDNGSVVAAITAAIAMIWAQEGNAGGFVVRRVRRSQGSTARARAARDEQIYSRL